MNYNEPVTESDSPSALSRRRRRCCCSAAAVAVAPLPLVAARRASRADKGLSRLSLLWKEEFQPLEREVNNTSQVLGERPPRRPAPCRGPVRPRIMNHWNTISHRQDAFTWIPRQIKGLTVSIPRGERGNSPLVRGLTG